MAKHISLIAIMPEIAHVTQEESAAIFGIVGIFEVHININSASELIKLGVKHFLICKKDLKKICTTYKNDPDEEKAGRVIDKLADGYFEEHFTRYEDFDGEQKEFNYGARYEYSQDDAMYDLKSDLRIALWKIRERELRRKQNA